MKKTGEIIRRQGDRDWTRRTSLIEPFRQQRAVWMGCGAALMMSLIMILGAINPHTHSLDSSFNTLFVTLSNIVLLVLLFLFNFWVHRIGTDRRRKFTTCFIGTMVIAFLFSVISFRLETLIYGSDNTSNTYPVSLIANLAAGLISYLVCRLLSNVTLHQQMVLENERLQSENLKTRYQALQQQVRPHFLFNTLSTLDGLIGIDDESAHQYLTQLAACFRYVMKKETEVTLADELQFSHSYLYLMQIRYGASHLHIVENIDPSLLSAPIATISIQLLVENAIKHNIISARHPLTITISTTPDRQIRVSNPIQPRADCEDSTGTGLDNLSLRYRLIYHREISIQSTSDTFSVTIPLAVDGQK